MAPAPPLPIKEPLRATPPALEKDDDLETIIQHNDDLRALVEELRKDIARSSHSLARSNALSAISYFR